MTQDPHKDCYGTMFPDALHFQSDKPMLGKAFSFELDTASGVSRSDRTIEVNMAEWDDCVKCSEFDHCYQLCMGQLALEAVIASE